jgi:hypothetical protein
MAAPDTLLNGGRAGKPSYSASRASSSCRVLVRMVKRRLSCLSFFLGGDPRLVLAGETDRSMWVRFLGDPGPRGDPRVVGVPPGIAEVQARARRGGKREKPTMFTCHAFGDDFFAVCTTVTPLVTAVSPTQPCHQIDVAVRYILLYNLELYWTGRLCLSPTDFVILMVFRTTVGPKRPWNVRQSVSTVN